MFFVAFLLGHHKTFKKYGAPVINVSSDLYDLLILYIGKLTRSVSNLKEDNSQPLFCKMDGGALEGIGNIIANTAEKVKHFLIRFNIHKICYC